MESLSILKFLTSVEEKNGIIRVDEIESVELSETSEECVKYLPCILFTMKSGIKISWNYNTTEKMYNEFEQIKRNVQKIIITN